jgi:hypothetical protein
VKKIAVLLSERRIVKRSVSEKNRMNYDFVKTTCVLDWRILFFA